MGKKKAVGRVVAGGMLRENTPIEDHRDKYGLWVKREDMSCLPPGPPFSKTRGVFAHILSRPERIIGALDTYHSQAGHAVARACQILGKKCINYYPDYKYEPGPRERQLRAQELGAELVPLKAGRSAILYHAAKKDCRNRGGYMMPNALKLQESVDETAQEVREGGWDYVLIPISSGTIAAGVVKGFARIGAYPRYLIHLGYSRSHDEVARYIKSKSGVDNVRLELIDEGYHYRDASKSIEEPPWPCDKYYDLKALRWWVDRTKFTGPGSCLLWNIG